MSIDPASTFINFGATSIRDGEDSTIVDLSSLPYLNNNYTITSITSTNSVPVLQSDSVNNYITTNKNTKIDIDELGMLVDVLKKRLLILTPNFEMHEKYPMLKELYDEYKALEALLSGPENN